MKLAIDKLHGQEDEAVLLIEEVRFTIKQIVISLFTQSLPAF